MVKLKPCPFCGEHAVFDRSMIYCADVVSCGCQMDFGDCNLTDEYKYDCWNKRYELDKH